MGALLGFIGLIIALPLTTLLIAYYKRYVTKEDDDGNAFDSVIEGKEITIAEPQEEQIIQKTEE